MLSYCPESNSNDQRHISDLFGLPLEFFLFLSARETHFTTHSLKISNLGPFCHSVVWGELKLLDTTEWEGFWCWTRVLPYFARGRSSVCSDKPQARVGGLCRFISPYLFVVYWYCHLSSPFLVLRKLKCSC